MDSLWRFMFCCHCLEFTSMFVIFFFGFQFQFLRIFVVYRVIIMFDDCCWYLTTCVWRENSIKDVGKVPAKKGNNNKSVEKKRLILIRYLSMHLCVSTLYTNGIWIQRNTKKNLFQIKEQTISFKFIIFRWKNIFPRFSIRLAPFIHVMWNQYMIKCMEFMWFIKMVFFCLFSECAGWIIKKEKWN